MPTLNIAHRVHVELKRATEILRQQSRWKGTQGSLADYLVAEHNCVVDAGALPIIMEIEHELVGVDPYTVAISQRSMAILVGLVRTFAASVGRDAVGGFILLENLPTVLYAPDLFPGLATAKAEAETSKLHEPYVWVYKEILHLLEELRTGRSTGQEAFQAFASMDIVELTALLETPAWRDFKYTCSLWIGADAERVRVKAPHDFVARLSRAAREMRTSVVHIASFVLWNELQAFYLATGDASKASVGQLLRHAMTLGN